MTDKNITLKNNLDDLLKIMAQLRDQNSGCPWDIEQNFETIAPYTIEEAYEVADAIQRGDMNALKDELGDLLFQVVFHSQLAQEQRYFTFDDVVTAIREKLTRRHPHVFDGLRVNKVDLAKKWELHKHQENGDKQAGILDGVSVNQPAINQAYKLQKKAASVGFDWISLKPVIDKLDEEIAELKDEIDVANNKQRIEEELGDVMFSCVNLARHLKIDPEWALRKANSRFYDRFCWIEKKLAMSGKNVDTCSLSELDELWNKAKDAT